MIKLKFIITLLLLLFNNNLLHSLTINGNNVLWSTDDKEEFLYSVYGKGTGKKIWKLYNIKEATGITLFHDIGIIPRWDCNGKKIATAGRDKIYLYFGPETEKMYAPATAEIVDLDFSYDGKKIVYSDGIKIYLLNLETAQNSYVTYGKNPLFINNGRSIIYLNEELNVSVLDKELNSKVVLTKLVNKLFPLRKQNSFIFQDNERNKIKLFDIEINKEILIVDEKEEITDFSVSQDDQFVSYILNHAQLFIANIPTRLKVEVLTENGIFTPRISKENKYCSYEKPNKIFIEEVTRFIMAFELDKIFKINIGASQGLTVSDTIEVYEERRNLDGEIIGMDANKFKGLLKVITVYDSYCYAKIDEEYKTDLPIEINDVAYWKEKELMGSVAR